MKQIADILNKVHCCDCLEFIKDMPDESVHCVVTSPPYWLLRDYKVFGQLGLEPTPEEYIVQMVEVFREVRRILRKDGSLWLNMGDSYWASGQGYGDTKTTNKGHNGSRQRQKPTWPDCGLKPKDLCMMPHRLAMALQKDGWWIRSDIVWAKPNPMPESCTDRPTKSHEYVFLCTKSAKYYYDVDAIREENVTESNAERPRMGQGPNTKYNQKRVGYEKNFGSNKGADADRHGKGYQKHSPAVTHPAGRNKRSVWTIPTQAYSEAHFATFPEKLVEPCIKAGTSEKGCCPECGKPWYRITEKIKPGTRTVKSRTAPGQTPHGCLSNTRMDDPIETKTIGWQPGCKCFGKFTAIQRAVSKPCIVFDPFFGSGTVGLVAYKLNRSWLGTELNPEYCKIAEKRIAEEQAKYGLFSE